MTIPKRDKRRKKGEPKFKDFDSPPSHKAILTKRNSK